MQRALMKWKRPEKLELVRQSLRAAHREDLIGNGKECLLRPSGPRKEQETAKGKGKPGGRRSPAKPVRESGQPRKPAPRKAGWAVAKPKKNAWSKGKKK